jgi:hypothetical protein
MHTRSWTIAAMAILGYGILYAQNPPKPAPVDVAITYDTLHINNIGGGSRWMQGGTVELQAPLYRGLGVAARVEGFHTGASSVGNVPLSLVTVLFGPRYTVASHSDRCRVFGEALVGESNAFDSLFSVGSGPVGSVNTGTTSSATTLAVEAGGGLDVRLTRRLAVRAIQVNYLYSQFPNASANVQNNFSLGAGIVLNFPQKASREMTQELP